MKTLTAYLVPFTIPLIIFSGTSFSYHEITYFQDNKNGAVSITFNKGGLNEPSKGSYNGRKEKGKGKVTIEERCFNWLRGGDIPELVLSFLSIIPLLTRGKPMGGLWQMLLKGDSSSICMKLLE